MMVYLSQESGEGTYETIGWAVGRRDRWRCR